jgi:hypothetical protein
MIFDVEPMIFPPGNVGGEFVRKVLVAGLLSKLDAGAPLQQMDSWRWVVVLLGIGSGKYPNGVRFRGRLHRNG